MFLLYIGGCTIVSVKGLLDDIGNSNNGRAWAEENQNS